MRKVLLSVLIVFILMVFAVGCTKQVKPGEEAASPQESVVITEQIYPMEAPEALTPAEKSIVEFKDVLFNYDKYDIRPDGRAVLDAVAPWLKKNNSVKILIEGHCDERGTNEYNLALGEKRAKAAKNYLISKGINSKRIRTITYGEEKPTCLAHNESCWQRNRRAHFVITK